ncbi:MAG: phosphoglucosamine mutase, partial [Clostridia bacterium]|nr:phosphoglucosamine mutase [Clostridia bacterium]
LGALASPVKLFPQKLKNVHVTSKDAVMQDEEILEKVKEYMEEIGDNGRVLLRRSGTEPVVRIMAECETEGICESFIQKIYQDIKKRGYICE